jgi:hypothetical protein
MVHPHARKKSVSDWEGLNTRSRVIVLELLDFREKGGRLCTIFLGLWFFSVVNGALHFLLLLRFLENRSGTNALMGTMGLGLSGLGTSGLSALSAPFFSCFPR